MTQSSELDMYDTTTSSEAYFWTMAMRSIQQVRTKLQLVGLEFVCALAAGMFAATSLPAQPPLVPRNPDRKEEISPPDQLARPLYPPNRDELSQLPPPQAQQWLGESNEFVIPPTRPPENLQLEIQNGRISLIARGAELRDVLTLLAEQHGLNLVMAQDAATPITITLNQVTLMDALEAVVSVAGYTWTTHRGIVHVSSISSNNTLTPHVQGRITRVFELDYVSAADLDVAIKGMLSPSGRSQVMLTDSKDNRRTIESIVIEDFPSFMHRIEQYIALVDVLPRQVLIQVHVLQVDLNDNERHGINFENLLRLAGSDIRINTIGLANAVAGQAIFAEVDGTDVDALLEALETHLDSETLASPRVLALNGQESHLQVGEKLGYRTSTTTETSTQESINFLEVGVVLNVTPRITRDDNVLLYIKPEVSSGEVNETTGLPNETTSEVETNLIVRSGQGIVIGGLIQENDSFTQSQAPVLGNIPVLGHLFKRRATDRGRSEIIFVLVPHIIPAGCGPDPWQGTGELVNQSNKLHNIDFNQSIRCDYNRGPNTYPCFAPQPQTILVPTHSPQQPMDQPAPQNTYQDLPPAMHSAMYPAHQASPTFQHSNMHSSEYPTHYLSRQLPQFLDNQSAHQNSQLPTQKSSTRSESISSQRKLWTANPLVQRRKKHRPRTSPVIQTSLESRFDSGTVMTISDGLNGNDATPLADQRDFWQHAGYSPPISLYAHGGNRMELRAPMNPYSTGVNPLPPSSFQVNNPPIAVSYTFSDQIEQPRR